MKPILTMLIISSGAAIGVYAGATDHDIKQVFFMFVGVTWGFAYRHWIY